MLLALLLLGACGPACTRSGGGPDAVVLIVIDTLRADHLGCYGSVLAKTPHLDALAAGGVRFSDAMTPAPVTLAAITSLLTGRWPFHHGVRDNDRYVLSPDEETLAERFHDAGWRTAAIVGSAILASDRGLAQGFDTYDDAFQGPFPVYRPALEVFADDFARTQRRADQVTDRALRAVDGFGKDPYFLFVHYFDVHSYYDPPPAYAALHPGRPYDGEVSFVDAEIGRLLGRLEHRHPLVIVVADHGEGLGEHGETEHGFLLFQSTLHVPLLVAGPGVPAGVVREDPVSLVDIAPTLAATLDLSSSGPAMDGRRLSWGRPETAPVSLYAETCRTLVSYGWSELRAVREGSMKLISGPRSELYDLARDPHENYPVSDPARVTALEKDLQGMTRGETRSAVLAALSRAADPARRELLESLGYLSGDEASPSALSKTYPNPADQLPLWEKTQEEKALYRRGVAYAAHGRFQEAIAVFDSVLVSEPGRADVYYNRGLARHKSGDEAGFRDDLESALHADAKYVPALASRANLAAKAGTGSQAIADWSRILELEPANEDALRGLSEWYLRENAFERALPYLRALVSTLPQDAPARLNLGLAAAKVGREKEAREHLEAFLRLAPGDPRAAEVRDMLESWK
jgi:arylsulfatase A-like enzyme